MPSGCFHGCFHGGVCASTGGFHVAFLGYGYGAWMVVSRAFPWCLMDVYVSSRGFDGGVWRLWCFGGDECTYMVFSWGFMET